MNKYHSTQVYNTRKMGCEKENNCTTDRFAAQWGDIKMLRMRGGPIP